MPKPHVTARRWGEVYGLGLSNDVAKPGDREYLDPSQSSSTRSVSRTTQKEEPPKGRVELRCLKCDQPFLSWNTYKNRICDPCRALNDKDLQAAVYSGFDVVMPPSIFDTVQENKD